MQCYQLELSRSYRWQDQLPLDQLQSLTTVVIEPPVKDFSVTTPEESDDAATVFDETALIASATF
jgi:hypothetical protein